MNGTVITMEELLSFIREKYPLILEKKLEIDYLSVLTYLENNQEIPYFNPDVPGISNDEKNKLLSIKQNGQEAVNKMKQMAARAKNLYGLDECLPGQWLDGSRTKTRKYLWTQMKYSTEADSPISISISVERKANSAAYYRVGLEIKDDDADEVAMAKFHSHLDIPCDKTAGLTYVSGRDESDPPRELKESQELIKKKVVSGEITKVRICKCIGHIPSKTNDYYDQQIMDAIKALIPYYNHVIGTGLEKEMRRAWLLTWNPAKWT